MTSSLDFKSHAIAVGVNGLLEEGKREAARTRRRRFGFIAIV
jgi:hypothetical protein